MEGSKMIKPEDLFDKYANVYVEKYMDVSLYKDGFDLFCENLDDNAKVLELACGPGNITQYLLEKRNDLNILGTDLAPKMLEIAKVHNPSAQFQLLDCRKMTGLNQTYDGIMCGFCLPYLDWNETESMLSDAYTCLNENGILYLSTMEDDYSVSGLKGPSSGDTSDQVQMYYYRESDLVKMLESCKFSVQHIDRKVYTGPDETEVTDLILIAKK